MGGFLLSDSLSESYGLHASSVSSEAQSAPAGSVSFPYCLVIVANNIPRLLAIISCHRIINAMASIASSLTTENEEKLQNLFSGYVRFHLLYKSSHHGADFDQLLNRFDRHGKYVLMVFLKSGSVRGAFVSKSLMDEMEYSDDETFLFKIEGKYGDRFPYSPTAITVSVDSDSISFGKGLNLKLVNGSWYERFSTDVIYGRRKLEDDTVYCTDVELHRVQGKF